MIWNHWPRRDLWILPRAGGEWFGLAYINPSYTPVTCFRSRGCRIVSEIWADSPRNQFFHPRLREGNSLPLCDLLNFLEPETGDESFWLSARRRMSSSNLQPMAEYKIIKPHHGCSICLCRYVSSLVLVFYIFFWYKQRLANGFFILWWRKKNRFGGKNFLHRTVQ